MTLEDILPWRLPTIARLDNGNRVVAFSIPEEVFKRIEAELKAVKSVYEEPCTSATQAVKSS